VGHSATSCPSFASAFAAAAVRVPVVAAEA
jgi:hypothetical protein